MNIGDLIRLKRKARRLTQIELSKILLMSSYCKISYLEKNPKALLSIDLKTLYKLSHVLDIDINVLIEEKNKLKILKEGKEVIKT